MSLLLPVFLVAVVVIVIWAFLEKRKLEKRIADHAAKQKELENKQRNFSGRMAVKAAELSEAVAAAQAATAIDPEERTEAEKDSIETLEDLKGEFLSSGEFKIIGLGSPHILFGEVSKMLRRTDRSLNEQYAVAQPPVVGILGDKMKVYWAGEALRGMPVIVPALGESSSVPRQVSKVAVSEEAKRYQRKPSSTRK